MNRLLLINIIALSLVSCEKLQELGKDNIRKKLSSPNVSEKELEKWKDKLGLQEAEIQKLDEEIRKLARKTKEAGALSWRIARAYMKVGSFEKSTEEYSRAVAERIENTTDTMENPTPEIHKFETAIAFFEKALKWKEMDDDLLFETALSYANASRDRGWDKEKRTIAVKLFSGLTRKNSSDLRYPYQLALIYFDSSENDGLIDGIEAAGYNDTEKAMRILKFILEKNTQDLREEENIPVRFTYANFLYRLGKEAEAETEYQKIKSQLEDFHKTGKITENLAKNTSYQNVMRNLKKIQERKAGGPN
ncbi:MAG: hypothetical protein SFU98_17405 [Leptospiraceae bacterium]|nr:hypothetical protein [Leptospiraceae bacterium]